jgi:hypothetical protein
LPACPSVPALQSLTVAACPSLPALQSLTVALRSPLRWRKFYSGLSAGINLPEHPLARVAHNLAPLAR